MHRHRDVLTGRFSRSSNRSLVLLALVGGAGCGASSATPDHAVASAPFDGAAPDADAAVSSCGDPTGWARASGDPLHLPDGGNLNGPGYLSDPSVLSYDGGFQIWFTSSPAELLRTAYAESADGIVVDRVVDPVLAPTPGGWDQNGIETPSVARSPSGPYVLLYTGDEAGLGQFAIGLATSNDGIHWTKHDGPVLPPMLGWESACLDPPACSMLAGGTLEPSILYDAARSLYELWYVGWGTLGSVTTYRMGYATSPDAVTWTRYPTPVFEPGSAGQWDENLVSQVNVTRDGSGLYHLFYFGSTNAQTATCGCMACCALQAGEIGHATSTDGVNWVRDPLNPILRPEPDGWESWTLGGPSALAQGSQMWVWYFGTQAKQSYASHLGLALATCAP